jgi:hypothetical protein
MRAVRAGVRRAPKRDRTSIGRSIPGDSLFDPAGQRALHRRGRRSPSGPRRNARSRHPIGARRQPGPGPQGESRRRSLPRSSAQDAAGDANEHGVRAAQFPKAPPRTRGRRPAKLRPAFFRTAASPDGPDRSGCHGCPNHVDGGHRMDALRWPLAGRRASGRPPTAAPDLNLADVATPRRSAGRSG